MSSNSSGSSGSNQSLASSLSSDSQGSLPSCDAGVRQIRLNPFFQRYFVPNVVDGYRMRIVADQNCNMPKEIFRYFAYPPHVLTGEERAEFTGICSMVDLEELPAGAPLDDACPKAFRLDYIDVVVESRHAAYEAWDLIQQEVVLLKETLDFAEDLEAAEPVLIS